MPMAFAIERTDPDTAATLQAVKKKLGMLPNLIATLVRAPAALRACGNTGSPRRRSSQAARSRGGTGE